MSGKVLGTVMTVEQDNLIADQACAAIDWHRVQSAGIEIGLGASDKERAWSL